MYRLTTAAVTNVGSKRQNNEDYVGIFEPKNATDLLLSGCLYLVADGVGGAEKGERASQYAVQNVLYDYYRNPELPVAERLTQAIRQSSQQIYSYAAQHLEGRMATTMVAAVIREDILTIANVGDSRAYLIRDNIARQITDDHSMVGEMVREGIMTEQDAQRSNMKNRLLRSLGGEGNVVVDIFADIKLLPGDRLLMCSDGLTSYALNQDIERMSEYGTPNEIVNRLVAFANGAGGADNISVILVEVGTQIPMPGPATQATKLEPASWDNMPTERYKPLRLKTYLQRKRKFFWLSIIIGFVILGVLAAIAVFFWG